MVRFVNGEVILYDYDPSLPAAVIAVIIFAILSAAHGWRMIKHRTWFCIPFVIGGLFEVVGYVGRALSHSDSSARTPYIIQSVLILIAPALFAATIYMTLGRVMRATHGEKYSIVRAHWLTKLFVTGDILSFFIQGGGGGILTKGNTNDIKMGQDIILGGLFLQIIMFGLFIITSIIFHLRLRKYPTQRSYRPDIQWEKMIWVLYSVSIIIMVRNIFRVIEYMQGQDGSLLTSEWPIYVFDGLLMASTMTIFFWWYPTIAQPKDDYNLQHLESQSFHGDGVRQTTKNNKYQHRG